MKTSAFMSLKGASTRYPSSSRRSPRPSSRTRAFSRRRNRPTEPGISSRTRSWEYTTSHRPTGKPFTRLRARLLVRDAALHPPRRREILPVLRADTQALPVVFVAARQVEIPYRVQGVR